MTGGGAQGGRVLIVGGGASGVLLASQILEGGGGRVAVSLVEKGELLGCGVAYATRDPAHLLNTRVASMSAVPQRPDHFLDWLRREEPAAADPQGFVSRGTFGRYMMSLLAEWRDGPALACRRDECVAIEVGPGVTGGAGGGVTARLARGGRVEADLAVLATGHAPPDAGADAGAGAAALTQPWGRPSEAVAVSPDARVLIVGSGLTMVDQVLSLLGAGHEGPIDVVSRRGLLPQVHGPVAPLAWGAADLPAAGRVAPLLAWLRREARAREAAGGTWRDAVDGLRPHIQGLWQAMPEDARRRFLRHASAHWEVHRHRMPPSSADRLARAMAAGRLRLTRARFEGAGPGADGRLAVRLTLAGGRRLVLAADRVVDARGIRRDPEAHATPLVAGLLKAGLARVDPLRLGLDVGPDCAVIGRDGAASDRLFAIGPASRAAFWEITAVPDIRVQAARLAARLVERLAGRPAA